MKKRCYFIAVLLVFSAHIQAAGSLLQAELQGKLSKLSSFQADFSQQVKDVEGELLMQSQGKIKLKQPNRLHWQVFEPEENKLIADGKTLWHVDPFVEQVTAMDQQQAVANNPVILLTNPDSNVWQHFDIVKLDDGYQIEAKSEDSQVAKLILKFAGEQLASLSFIDRQQQVSQLVFSNAQQNQQIDDQVFNFSLPQGYELDDQRNQ